MHPHYAELVRYIDEVDERAARERAGAAHRDRLVEQMLAELAEGLPGRRVELVGAAAASGESGPFLVADLAVDGVPVKARVGREGGALWLGSTAVTLEQLRRHLEARPGTRRRRVRRAAG